MSETRSEMVWPWRTLRVGHQVVTAVMLSLFGVMDSGVSLDQDTPNRLLLNVIGFASVMTWMVCSALQSRTALPSIR